MVKYRLLSEGCFILAITWEKYSNCHLNYGLAAVYKKHYRKKKRNIVNQPCMPRAFTATSLKGVCSLSFRKNFKKVTKTPPQQLP
jgi:mRNA-degrading endonuclease YafQ of YafQ-DinJ toxin-antitoxin module